MRWDLRYTLDIPPGLEPGAVRLARCFCAPHYRSCEEWQAAGGRQISASWRVLAVGRVKNARTSCCVPRMPMEFAFLSCHAASFLFEAAAASQASCGRQTCEALTKIHYACRRSCPPCLRRTLSSLSTPEFPVPFQSIFFVLFAMQSLHFPVRSFFPPTARCNMEVTKHPTSQVISSLSAARLQSPAPASACLPTIHRLLASGFARSTPSVGAQLVGGEARHLPT